MRVSLILILLILAESVHAQEFSSHIHMISFGESGVILDNSARRVESLLNDATTNPPTDVYVMSHGWNNSFSDAQESYTALMNCMQKVARSSSVKLVEDNYRSLAIGISWPSKAWESSSGRSTLDSNESDVNALYRAFSVPSSLRESSPEEYLKRIAEREKDIADMERLLSLSFEETQPEHYEEAGLLFAKYRQDSTEGDGNSSLRADDMDFFYNATNGRAMSNSRLSIRDGLRVFTYWQMKERAGIVGQNGVHEMVAQIQRALPKAKIHLLGHSFGAKLALACVGKPSTLPRNIDTLVLLQGAVSYQAMSPGIGGYAIVPSRVNGPVICTFSKQDERLGWQYETASRVAGHRAEGRSLAPSPYAALGAIGTLESQPRLLSPALDADPYAFSKGVYDVNGDDLIRDHSDVKTDAIARMIWSAVRPSTTGRSILEMAGGRSVNEDEGAALVEKAHEIVKSSEKTLSDKDVINLFLGSVEAFAPKPSNESIIAASHFDSFALALDGTPNELVRLSTKAERRISSFPLSGMLRSRLVDDRFMVVDSYSKNMRNWIVSGKANGHVGRIINPQLPCESKDNAHGFCVAVVKRAKQEGQRPDNGWKVFGSGTLIDWNTVLTAAHVLPLESPGSEWKYLSAQERSEKLEGWLKENEFGILIGNDINTPKRFIVVEKRIEHPTFRARQGSPWSKDLAILKLTETATAEEVGFNTLPSIGSLVPPTGSDPLLVSLVGYGSCKTDGSSSTVGIRRVVDNVPVTVPAKPVDAEVFGCDLDSEFVAGGAGLDTCNGDSGGPVVQKLGGKTVVVGCTSREARVQLMTGRDPAGLFQTTKCGQGGIYGKCDADWIRLNAPNAIFETK